MSSKHTLKRSASSLDCGNVCTACGMEFNAPHLLIKHERNSCPQTLSQLAQLRRQALELARPGSQARKRRRLEEHSLASSSQAEGTDAASHDTGRDEHDQSSQQSTSTQARVNASRNQPAGRSSTRESISGGHASSSSGALHSTKEPAERERMDSALASSDVNGSHPSASTSAQADSPTSAPGATASQAPSATSAPGDGNGTIGHGPDSTLQTMDPSPAVTFDAFRLRKKYTGHQSPAKDPDQFISSNDLYDSRNHVEQPEENESTSGGSKKPEASSPSTAKEREPPSYGPFPNRSSFDLGEWFYGQGTQKSQKDFKGLVNILTSPTFSLDDIKGTKWTRVFQDLGKNKDEIHPARSQWVDDSGWKTTDVEIEVPVHNRMEKGQGLEMRVAGTLHHRSIVSILEEKIRNTEASKLFHLDGHELIWKPGASEDSPEFRVVSELYNSDAFLQAQGEVRAKEPSEIGGCNLPRVVVGVMFWSDATHLSTFSNSKLWPLYMLFGNESKYQRTNDASDSCYHVAYFDTLSDSFKDYITERTGGKVPPNLAAYLNREFFHAQWVVILDDDLLKAIVEGIVIMCSDGVERRFFIRIFTYSADYPEKVLIATIRSRSDCPCVRCLTQKKNLNQMGSAEDIAFRKANPRLDTAARQQEVVKAREAIAQGLAVGGEKVLAHLTHSGVPNINAFSSRLSSMGFNIFSALVVDMLHEFEIGVFKALFLHLIRVLDALFPGSVLVHELDKRYRAIPTFNQTIRRFSSNVSQLRRRAARDYEDLLQCAIPAFHGLLPEGLSRIVLNLLYINARWHALAKLRMQTDATIILLEDATSQLGKQFRSFITAVDKINTTETASEAQKRARSQKQNEGKKQETKKKETKKKDTKGGKNKAAERLGDITAVGAQKGGDKTATTTIPASAASTPAATGSTHALASVPASGDASQNALQAAESNPTSSTPASRPSLPKVRLIVRSPAPPSSQPEQSGSRKRVKLIVRPPDSTAQPNQPNAATDSPVVLTSPSTPISGPANPVGSLPTEEANPLPVAGRSQPAANAQAIGSSAPPTGLEAQQEDESAKQKRGRRPKKMNIATVKFHALGHYPATIRLFGPSDLYSTEWGENFHRSPKAWFKLTSKRYIRKELSRHERKRARLKKAKQRILSKPQSAKAQGLKAQRAAARDPNIHHYIGSSTQSPIRLIEFARNDALSSDAACSLFVPNLKKYLFRRFLSDGNGELSRQDLEDLHQMYDWSKVSIKNDSIYTHRIMRIKYTTYDARRDEDIIHIETDQSNVMLLDPAYSYGSTAHPFIYGKVIAILHADVGYVGDIGRRGREYFYRPIEFLWVRWYRLRPNNCATGELALDQAELIPIDESGSHSFIDPSTVLRACHIVPNFDAGRRYIGGIGKSVAANDGLDYKGYFINRFVDRDMFMRYEWGLAVGHTYTHNDAAEANKKVLHTRTLQADSSPVQTAAVESVGGSTSGSGRPPDVEETGAGSAPDPSTSLASLGEAGEKELDEEEEDAEEDVDPRESDGSPCNSDEEDYLSDPGRDSEDDRAVEMFGDELGF